MEADRLRGGCRNNPPLKAALRVAWVSGGCPLPVMGDSSEVLPNHSPAGTNTVRQRKEFPQSRMVLISYTAHDNLHSGKPTCSSNTHTLSHAQHAWQCNQPTDVLGFALGNGDRAGPTVDRLGDAQGVLPLAGLLAPLPPRPRPLAAPLDAGANWGEVA